MNVGIFTNSYKPITTGVVNSIRFFRQGLVEKGHKVYVFAPRFYNYKDDEEDIYRFPSVNLSTRVKFPVATYFFNRILREIPKLDLDIVHCHHPFILGTVGAAFARRLGIPLIYTFHTQYERYSHYVPFNQNIVRRLTKETVIRYIQRCDCVIAPTRSIRDMLVDSYKVSNRIEVVPNAIDLKPYENLDGSIVRKRYGLYDERLLISVGRLAAEKNLPFLLRAFREMVYTDRGLMLMLVGGGPEEANLRRLAKRLGIDRKVIFAGPVDYQLIPGYLASADMFVMASTTEVGPLVLIEAMAAGLPVVAVDACGARDAIVSGVNGILTNQDERGFAESVLGLLKDDASRRRISSGARETAQGYSIGSATEKLLEVYESMRKAF